MASTALDPGLGFGQRPPRRYVTLAATLLALALAACGAPAAAPGASRPAAPAASAAAPAAPPAAPAPAAAAPAGPSAAPAAGSAASGAAAGAPALHGDAAAFERVKEAAKREGRVVVSGPAIPAVRTGITEGFQQAYGIAVEYLPLRSSELMTRIERERQLGAVTIDLYIGGTPSGWTQAERGQIDDIKPLLLDPAILNPAVWRDGAIHLAPSPASLPADFNCCLRTAQWVYSDLFVNTDLVPAGSITSWKDLLKPEYKGKITSYDGRVSGPGRTTAAYLWALFGDDYVRDLWAGQQVVTTRDDRQLGEWVVRGNYPIGLGILPATVEPFRAQGLPIERVFPQDGPGVLVGGFGGIRKMKDSPNPNAATLFINWFASKDAQEMWESAAQEPSLRTDVPHNVPDYIKLKPGVQYPYDDDDPAYTAKYGEPVLQKMQEILGR